MSERFGEYELIRKIATGGMAEIYLARVSGVEGFSRRVVVKRMLPQLAVRPDFVQMFLDEARLAANLVHPNIVQVFNLGQVDGTYFMAMELIDGPHLGALFAHSLRQRRPLPLELCVYTVARSADGLHYAHEQRDPSTGQPLNIVHRDISPQNVLVSRHGDVKVTDFGVAKAETQQSKTRTGIIKGKVSYMSPEQCLGEPVDRRTDVFALGVVLYELLTRRRLYREKSDLLTMQRITGEDLRLPSGLNPAVDPKLDEIAAIALSKNREERFTTAADLSEALDMWLATQGHADCRAQLQRWMESHAAELGIGGNDSSKTDAPVSGTPTWERSGKAPAAPSVDAGEEGTVSTPALDPARGSLSGKHPSLKIDDDELSTARVARTLVEGTTSAEGDALSNETMVVPPPGPDLEGGVPVTAVTADKIASELEEAPPRGRPMAAMVGGVMALCLAVVAVGFYAARNGEAGEHDDVVTVEAAVRPIERATDEDAPLEDPPTDVDEEIASAATTADADKPPTLHIETVPSGVLVVVDGRPQENSPVKLTLDKAAGELVEVRAVFTDQPPMTQKVRLQPGENRLRLLAKVRTRVVSEPPGAQVFVGDSNVGFTPREDLFLTPGRRVTVAVVKPGFKRWTRQLTPKAGQGLEIEATLERIPERREPVRAPVQAQSYGSLQVSSKPWGIVYVDGRRVGPTPVLVPKVRAGSRKVRIVNNDDGFGFSKTTTVDVKKNQQSNVGFVFEKQGESYELVRLVQ